MKPYLIAVIIGAFLQNIAISHTLKMRGHIAFGGEYLILPLCILLMAVTRKAYSVFKIKEDNESVQK